MVNEIAILILIFMQKWGKNTNADVLSRFPENIKNVTRSTRMKYLSAVKDWIQTQECCNEAWLCAVNTNSNLLK